MTFLTFLEVGNLGGLVAMIIGIMLIAAFVISLFITVFVKLIYESKDGRKFSKSQFWQTMFICLLICGLISGIICGGM